MKNRIKGGKKRGGRPLTLEERITIEIEWKKGRSVTETAKKLRRDKSTVSREIGGRARYGAGSYKTADGTVESCDAALCARLAQIPRKFLKTLTRDRGSENRGHIALAQKTGFDIFFAHPYASYERGSNENGNGLFRRLFPKGTDFATISTEEISTAEYLINTRPRKRLGGRTPAEVFYQNTGVALFS